MKGPISIRRNVSETHLDLPDELAFEDWRDLGITLGRADRAVSWWIGDWWAYGGHHYGERADVVRDEKWQGPEFQTCKAAGWVCSRFERVRRRTLLSFTHHREVAALEPVDADRLLDVAEVDKLSAMELRARVRRLRAENRIGELIAMPLPVNDPVHVLYLDPPWRYENPPMGGGNRSIENHYPTMTLDELLALDIKSCATDDAIMFMWATAPKLAECMQLIEPWGFVYRTNIIWDKIDIGMGYHARNQHEQILICKRGTLPPPEPSLLESSIYSERRTDHSRKPLHYAEMIERQYPRLRKREFFSRDPARPGWETPYGNQQIAMRAA